MCFPSVSHDLTKNLLLLQLAEDSSLHLKSGYSDDLVTDHKQSLIVLYHPESLATQDYE